MQIPIPEKQQCFCLQCRNDRVSPFRGDCYYHANAQAHLTNYPTYDTKDHLKAQLKATIDREIDKFSDDDWKSMLEYYEYLSFEYRIMAWDKIKKCNCEMATLAKQGCQCGGL